MSDPFPQQPPTQNAREWLAWIHYKASPLQLDRMVDKVALQTEASLKEGTPKGWFGQVRKSWHTQKPDLGVRIIANDATASNGAPIMLFLEEGTAQDGTGFIYPKSSNRLYVPLTKRAASGWRQSLKYGVDYILKKFVRGQKGQHIVANERPKVAERLLVGMKEVVREILQREGMSRGAL